MNVSFTNTSIRENTTNLTIRFIIFKNHKTLTLMSIYVLKKYIYVYTYIASILSISNYVFMVCLETFFCKTHKFTACWAKASRARLLT